LSLLTLLIDLIYIYGTLTDCPSYRGVAGTRRGEDILERSLYSMNI